MRTRRIILLAASGFAILVALGFLGFVCPLPPEKTLRTEVSPDGRHSITYSWRPSGLAGKLTGCGVWVYGTVRDRQTGQIIRWQAASADVPDEAEARLEGHGLWP